MKTYLDFGRRNALRMEKMLAIEGLSALPTDFAVFQQLDQGLKKAVGGMIPLVLSDNYEHFMARLPCKTFAAQQVIVRGQIGGFTVGAGYWKWLEFLSQRITREAVDLVADYFSGKHNKYPRQFNKDYWYHVVDDYDGYLPLRVEYAGEGVTFTGVPFPLAQVHGETPAVWVNEPLYIQIGHLSHVATIAAQFASILEDPWRFIDVMFRAQHNKEESDDVLLAMLIGGGIISTSNDLGAFVNGAPFKPSGTTGHCWYQQFDTLKEALQELLGSPLGPYSTVLLDVYAHSAGFADLQTLIREGYPAPFAERPDSGDTLKQGMHDLTVLQDQGQEIKIVLEDGYLPADVARAERMRKQYGLTPERLLYGAGGAFVGARRSLETAYKACLFHDGTFASPENTVETMKICLDDKMKQSLPGRIDWFFNTDTGMFMIGCAGETPPDGYRSVKKVLYDGISDPGHPYVDPDYCPVDLTGSSAIQDGIARSRETRKALGPDFTREIGENRHAIGMTQALRRKRERIYKRALDVAGNSRDLS